MCDCRMVAGALPEFELQYKPTFPF
jgi:hypothetical protein